ncbi:MAG: hypothetical protein Q8P30_03485 [Candidatus Uhrbacteria bacterium]|nr:hypothetical protein [Candidatus Uhrbacteria bacterium]
MSRIAKTGFYTSLIAYVVFALADYWRPGFVSYVFSVHWFLLVSLVFGVMWTLSYRSADVEDEETGKLRMITATLLRSVVGISLLIIVWREGEVFGDFRIFLALVAFALPWLLSASKEKGKMREERLGVGD